MDAAARGYDGSAMRRDEFLKSIVAAGAAGCLPFAARAGAAISIMIPATPGGGWDATGRALGRALQEAKAADSVAYENKGGAAGALGLAQFVAARHGDPQALMVMGAVMLGGIIAGRPPVSLAQATPVARLASEYNGFVVPANSRFRSMNEVVAQLRKDPASIKWGGGSRGATEHIAAVLIARAADIDAAKINYVGFRGGGEAIAAMLAGDVTVGGGGWSELADYVQAGKLRGIAVTSPHRLDGVNVPTLKEQGIDVQIANWRGVYGAPAITAAQRQALTAMVVAAVGTRSWSDALRRNRWTPALLTGDAFDRFVQDEFAGLRATMRKAGMI
jgi:putative tricarboxylic transport membrane protein